MGYLCLSFPVFLSITIMQSFGGKKDGIMKVIPSVDVNEKISVHASNPLVKPQGNLIID